MALLNKLFPNRRKNHTKHQDNVSERLFSFSKDQVRVVVFRECDFRGRKLLFDSTTVHKTSLSKNDADSQEQSQETYTEINSGHGYTLSKPNADVKQLGEMIFGSVAMSYRGTFYKIHSLNSPQRLMYTQVFPSPRGVRKIMIREHGNRNGYQSSKQNLEHSVRLDDSGASSINSIAEQMSLNSNSDTFLVCRTLPLDVPVLNNTPQSVVSSPEMNGDSGIVGEQSYSSGSSENQFVPAVGSVSRFLGGSVTVSSGSLYRRWLRSTSTSLERSNSHINCSASADDCCTRTHQRGSKLGLAIIIHLSSDSYENMSHFLMEHAAFLESMVWRARQGVEAAYLRYYNFISLMNEMSDCVCQCLMELFTGPHLTSSLWLSLSNVCDNFSDNKTPTCMQKAASCSSLFSKAKMNESKSCSVLNTSCSSDGVDKNCDFTFLNLTKLLKSDVRECCDDKQKNPSAEQFLSELCELLESVDVKHTNFFISTLLTAVLTHHLGWVATTFSSAHSYSDLHKPHNALWGQLVDLYGAVGHPAKIAHTVITGTNNGDLISKILNSLTYFIRCCDIQRKDTLRVDVEGDNSLVNSICHEYSCIPKEYYKKYEDHLREMENCSVKEREMKKEVFVKQRNEPQAPNVRVCATDQSYLLSRKITVETQTSSYKTIAEEKGIEMPSVEDKKVVFLLGDDENLDCIKKESNLDNSNDLKHSVPASNLKKGLKKETSCFNLKDYVDKKDDDEATSESSDNVECNSSTKVFERPTVDAVLTTNKLETASSDTTFKDEDFVTCDGSTSIKPCTSFSALTPSAEASCSSKTIIEKQNETEFVRSKSVPPEQHKAEMNDEMKSRYKYCGVKFNFQQHPQIVTNYMKSKNIELSRLPFAEKKIEFNQITLNTDTAFNFMDSDDSGEEVEALQTPSNASELECVSDLVTDRHKECYAKESVERLPKTFVRAKVPNTVVKEAPPKEEEIEREKHDGKMKVVSLPMPKSSPCLLTTLPVSYTTSLMRGLSQCYLSDMVLQGTSAPKSQWEPALRSDLSLAAKHPLLDQPIGEAVAIIANTDTWEVQLMSSHTYVVDKGSSGVRVGMSQLVANMLESLLQMWRLHAPAEHCLMHIEQRLQEFLMRSKALAHLLLATEFCTMEFLTSALQLEVNDVPLLMAVASTHSPEVTEKYGLSFQ